MLGTGYILEGPTGGLRLYRRPQIARDAEEEVLHT